MITVRSRCGRGVVAGRGAGSQPTGQGGGQRPVAQASQQPPCRAHRHREIGTEPVAGLGVRIVQPAGDRGERRRAGQDRAHRDREEARRRVALYAGLRGSGIAYMACISPTVSPSALVRQDCRRPWTVRESGMMTSAGEVLEVS